MEVVSIKTEVQVENMKDSSCWSDEASLMSSSLDLHAITTKLRHLKHHRDSEADVQVNRTHLVWARRRPDSEPSAETRETSSPAGTTPTSSGRSSPAGGASPESAAAASAGRINTLSINYQYTINTLWYTINTLWHHQSVTIIKKEPGNCWGRSRNGCRWQHQWRASWRAHGWPLTWCPPCWKSPLISQHALGQRQTGDLYCEISEFDEWY